MLRSVAAQVLVQFSTQMLQLSSEHIGILYNQ